MSLMDHNLVPHLFLCLFTRLSPNVYFFLLVYVYVCANVCVCCMNHFYENFVLGIN